jgi:hypothetical protein
MSFVQVIKMEPLIKNRMGTRNLFSHRMLHLRLQAIKLLASLTYPLKKPKCRLGLTLGVSYQGDAINRQFVVVDHSGAIGAH